MTNNAESEFEVFWLSVEKYTPKLDRNFCKILWAAQYRMFSSFTWIKTESDLKEAVEDIEENLKQLRRNEHPEATQIEELLLMKINDAFRLPLPYRKALQDIPIKLRQFQPPITRNREIPQSETSKGAEREDVTSRRKKSTHETTTASQIESFDYEKFLRNRIDTSIHINTPKPRPDKSKVIIVEVSKEFPKSWKIQCPFNECDYNVLVYCESMDGRLEFDIQNVDNHFKLLHSAPSTSTSKSPVLNDDGSHKRRKTLDSRPASSTSHPRSQSMEVDSNLSSSSINVPKYAKTRRKSFHRENLPRTPSEQKDFDCNKSLQNRIINTLDSLITDQEIDRSQLKLEVKKSDFPKSWRVYCPIIGCESQASVYCHIRDGKIAFNLANFYGHLTRYHGTFAVGNANVSSPKPTTDEAEVIISEYLSVEDEPTDSPESELQTEVATDLYDTLAKEKIEICYKELTHENPPDMCNLRLTTVSRTFPRKWIMNCPMENCDRTATLYCKLRNGQIIYDLNNVKSHYNRRHEGIASVFGVSIQQLDLLHQFNQDSSSSSTSSVKVRTRRKSVGHEILPRTHSELRDFDFEASVRRRAKRSLDYFSPQPTPDTENLLVIPLEKNFPKKIWHVECPYDNCVYINAVYCYDRQGQLQFVMTNFDNHLKKKHGKPNELGTN